MNKREMAILRMNNAQRTAMILEIARMDLKECPLTHNDLVRLILDHWPQYEQKINTLPPG
jgi:hypothetical protein